MRHMWKAILGAGDNVRLICSHSDMMRNTYDVVYDVVYDITYCISYTISYAYTMSYIDVSAKLNRRSDDEGLKPVKPCALDTLT